MKILILEWDSFGHEYIVDALHQEACEIDYFPWPFGEESMRENPELENKLSDHMKVENYYFVFSFNFFPIAAKVCYQHGTRYVSWVYDSPFLLLYSKHIGYQTNQIYLFDKSTVKEFRDKGDAQVEYLPLAAPVEYYDKLNRYGSGEKYKSDISFVGSTYCESRNDFYSFLDSMDQYTAGYLQAVMSAQKELAGVFILEDCLTADILERLKSVCPLKKEEDEWESDAWMYANFFLARKVTAEERIELLNELAVMHEVVLYSIERDEKLSQVIQNGSVDYLSEMPLVFKNSKINLNISLRSIHTGIPLRAMEIMGCGGFLITNYQEDFLEFFEPGVDYVYYLDKEDLKKKVEYYLHHEEERISIARNGYTKMKAGHTYRHRVQQILRDVMKREEIELNDRICKVEQIRKNQGGSWNQLEIEWEKLDTHSLITETEKQMEWMDREREALFRLKDKILELVDNALKERSQEAYERISNYFKKNVVESLYAVFSELFYVYIFIHLYRLEKSEKLDYTIKKYTSYRDLIRVYKQSCFYLRRLDSGLDQQSNMEIFQFLRREGLSSTALMLILHSNPNLDASAIKNKLEQLMKSEGTT